MCWNYLFKNKLLIYFYVYFSKLSLIVSNFKFFLLFRTACWRGQTFVGTYIGTVWWSLSQNFVTCCYYFLCKYIFAFICFVLFWCIMNALIDNRQKIAQKGSTSRNSRQEGRASVTEAYRGENGRGQNWQIYRDVYHFVYGRIKAYVLFWDNFKLLYIVDYAWKHQGCSESSYNL